MINQEEAQKWLVELKNPNNLKTTKRLTQEINGKFADCCLGLFIRVVCQINPKIYSTDFVYGVECRPATLPKEIAEKLNITKEGMLTLIGRKIINSKYLWLTEINDFTYREDKNFLGIAADIERLVNYEWDTGEECFVSFQS